MTKLKAIVKFVLIAVAIIAGLIHFYNQNLETRMLLGIYALISYLAYLANQRVDKLTDKITKDKFYICTFEKEVLAVESDDVVASFKIECKLPFPPFIGLEVCDSLNPISEDSEYYKYDPFQDFYSGKIITVVWRSSRFTCKVEPHKMTPQNKLEDVIIAHCVNAWKLRGDPFGENSKLVLEYIEKELLKLESTEGKIADMEYRRLEALKKKLQHE